MSNDARSPRICRMLDDPDLSGDLLLVGLGFARFLDYGGLPAGERIATRHVAAACWPNRAGNFGLRSVRGVLADDARGYRPVAGPSERRCCGPMVRRSGECGKETRNCGGYFTDWDTGEQTWRSACSRHRDWFWAQQRANWAAKPENPPLPVANHGGALARHIPEFDWPKIWHWATRGKWVEHPEDTPWRKPTLTLILGDGGSEVSA